MTEEGRTQQILITSDFSIKYTPKETLSESFHFTTEIGFAGESKEKINLKKKKKRIYSFIWSQHSNHDN